MPHFEEPPNTQELLRSEQDRAAARNVSFDAARVDSCLVFWPDKVVDLSYLIASHDRTFTAKDKSSHMLLVGQVVHGHAHEVAVVVVGTIQAERLDGISDKLASTVLSAVGFVPAEGAAIKADDFPSFGLSAVWLTMSSLSSSDELPTIVSVHFTELDTADGAASIHASPPDTASCAVNLIVYSVPNSRMLQYFALESLRLAPVSGMKLVSAASALLMPESEMPAYSRLMAAASAPSNLQTKFLHLLLLDPVHWRSLRSVRPQEGRLPRGTSLRKAVEYINRLRALHNRLAPSSKSNGIGNGGSVGQHRDGKDASQAGLMSVIGDAITAMALALQRILRHALYIAKERRAVTVGLPVRQTGRVAPPWRLTTISACARQLDVRISQLIIAPRLASRLRYLRKEQKLPINEIAAPYIGLWNAVWLIANDIIIGHAVSVLLLQNRAQLATLGRRLTERYLLDCVLWLLSWLENWPAGLKLNTELSLFFSDAYSSLTSAWHAQALLFILSRLDTVVTLMALAGRFMGVTMVLCMVQDLVSICTLHVTVFYILSIRTLGGFIYVLSSLFDIFRGKKRNALRGGRLDDASYELDQLLLGTLLFTLVAFLFPTVYVYYLAFGLIRFVVVAFESGVMETCLGLLNHLPLFALMLRVKDPHRLPAGVWLQEVESTSTVKGGLTDQAKALPTGRFRLRSRPLAIGDIFEGYSQHVGGVFEVPSMLLRCVLGRPLRRSQPPPQ